MLACRAIALSATRLRVIIDLEIKLFIFVFNVMPRLLGHDVIPSHAPS